MKRTTPTLLATLLLAGSAGMALAQDQPSPPTMTPPPTTAPPMTTNSPSLSSPSLNDGPAAAARLSQDQAQSPPGQSTPNTSENSGSQDLAAGGGRPGRPATAEGSGADGSGQDVTPAWVQPAGTTADRAHRRPVRHVAKSDPDGDRMTDALNILGSDGYVDIQSLTPQGDQFVANAVLNGRNVSVVVDPQTRQVTNRS
jgi:hypothetical protein